MFPWREMLRGERALHLRVARRLHGVVREPILRHRARQLAHALRCPGMLRVDPQNLEIGWSKRVTSRGERAIIEYLRCQVPQRKSPRILHVGIGTGDLGRALSGLGAEVTGISIAGGEIANARGAYRRIHLLDKYALPELAAALEGAKFHWIVDVSLFSYACCWGHAIRFLWFLDSCLTDGGSILTHSFEARYAPTGHILTPALLERLAILGGLQVTAGPHGILLLGRSV